MGNKGFTLAELMVSFLIAGILMSAAFPMFLSVYRRWESERERNLAVRTCDQIYENIEQYLKFADRDELDRFLQGETGEDGLHVLADESRYDLESDIRIQMEACGDGFLSLRIIAMSSKENVIYEKTGTVLALNLIEEEESDE